jgi:hypothetical protein
VKQMGRRVSEKKKKEQFLYERRRQLEIMEGILVASAKGCDIYIELRKTKALKEVANTCARNCKLISNVQKEKKMFLETIR